MEKVRIYELAKELNTTSKRLIEKLSEIKIDVKNHMSYLEGQEVEALYKHIGIISHEGEKKGDNLKNSSSFTPQNRTEPKKQDIKDRPRIFRTTEISNESSNVDKQKENNEKYKGNDNRYRENDDKKRNGNSQNGRDKNEFKFGRKFSGVKVSTASSGLRAGFVRETDPLMQISNKKSDPVKDNKVIKQDDNKETQVVVAEAKVEMKHEVKPLQKNENNIEQKPEVKLEQKVEPGIEVKADDKIKVEGSTEHEIKIEVEKETKNVQSKLVANDIKVRSSEEENNITTKIEDTAAVKDANSAQKKNETSINDSPFKNKETDKAQKWEGKPRDRYNHSTEDNTNKIQPKKPFRANENIRNDNAKLESGSDTKSMSRDDSSRVKYEGQSNSQNDNNRYNSNSNQRTGNSTGEKNYSNDRNNFGQRNNNSGEKKYYNDRNNPGQRSNPSDRNNLGQRSNPNDRSNPGQRSNPNDRSNLGQRSNPNDRSNPGQRSNPNDRSNTANISRREGYKGNNPNPRSNSNFSGQRTNDFGAPRLNIPKDILDAPGVEEEIRIDENKRKYQNKDVDKGIKREQKREVPKAKATADVKKKFKPRDIILEPAKGVSQVLQEDALLIDELLETSPISVKKPRKPFRPKKERKGSSEASKLAVERAVLTSIKIGETVTVKELAEHLKKTAADVIKRLMIMGTMVTLNQEIDFEIAAIIADEYGVKAEKEIAINAEDLLFDDELDDESKLIPRPPVVVVMGHVDHGKTSLLDAIRKTNVIESEEGGITQHIGAYTVKINDRNITFLDTPGHEAFTAMRARGAKITDIAILVVAADDGVMPQTIEAINHAKAAGVTIIVAINKVDKPSANPDKIKQQLTEYGLVSEDWGGDTIMVPVSAKKRENIDSLLEMVLLTADMMELKANPDKQAKGTIIEAKLDKNRGPIATLLVQRGTLNVGDSIITGTIFGRIRAMNDDRGQSIKTAGPSTPVEILGLPEVSESGELFYAIKDEKLAKILADKRRQQHREDQLKSSSMVSLEDLFTQIQEGQIKDLNIILKADVQGSVEAVKQSIEKLSNPEVRINVIHGGVGAITESDVKLAEVSNAIIIGFNVRPGPNVSEIAEISNVDIKLYRVIYNAISDIEAAMKGMLEPKLKEVIQGHAEIRQIYKASGVGNIGGAYVTDGKITRNSSIRIVRNSVVVFEGKLESLKRFKDDAKEVAQGYECGVLIERFNDIKEGDIVEAYAMEEIEAK